MKMISTMSALCLLAGAAPALATPRQPQEATGLWLFDIATSRGTTRGAMTLVRQPTGYRGMLITNRGEHALPIRSLTVVERAMEMAVESPQGNVVFRGRLSRDGRSFSGHATYFDGQIFRMTGRRR